MKRAHAITAGNLLVFMCLACGDGKTEGVKTPTVEKELPAVKQDRPPVACWTFDEGSGLVVKDRTGNSHDGIIMANGKRTAWVEGRLGGKALEFNADRTKRNETGCIEIPKMGGLDFTRGLTVEMWVKFKTVDTQGTRFQLIDNANGDKETGFRLYFTWKALYFQAGTASSNPSALYTKPAQVMFETETWYHVAATFDGAVARLYLDGREVAVSEPGFAIEKGRDAIYIGAAPGGAAYGLEGAINEVKLYDYARSAVQVMKAAKF